MLNRRLLLGGAAAIGFVGCEPTSINRSGPDEGKALPWHFVERNSFSFSTKVKRPAWSRNQRYIAIPIDRGRIEVKELATGRSVFTEAQQNFEISSHIHFSPNGDELYGGVSSPADLLGAVVALTWDATTGKILNRFVRPQNDVVAAAFIDARGSALSPDGEFLVLFGMTRPRFQGCALVFKARNGEFVRSIDSDNDFRFGFSSPPTISIRNHLVLPSSARPYGDPEDYRVKLFDLTTGSFVRTIEGHRGYVRGAAFSADGSLLACAEDGRLPARNSPNYTVDLERRDRLVRVWNVDTRGQVGGMVHDDFIVEDLYWLGSSKYLIGQRLKYASEKRDAEESGGVVAVWDPNTNLEMAKKVGPGGLYGAYTILPSPDGKTVMIANWITAYIYDIVQR